MLNDRRKGMLNENEIAITLAVATQVLVLSVAGVTAIVLIASLILLILH